MNTKAKIKKRNIGKAIKLELVSILFASILLTGIAQSIPQQSINVAIIGSPGIINGGYLPTTGPVGELGDFKFQNLAPSQVTTANLAPFDTVILNVASREISCNVNILTVQQKTDLISFVGTGKKMIIYDSECSPQDYNWLPYKFTTANPGARGAQGTLTIVEENTLSSNDPASPYYIDANYLSTSTDAVGDMNVMTTYDGNWFIDMSGTNILGVTGPVHTYAMYPAGTDDGLFIYNGLDTDYMDDGEPNSLRKIWLQELQQKFNPSDLPGSIAVVGITLEPGSAKNTVGQSHTVTAKLTDQLGNPQPGITVGFSIIKGPNSPYRDSGTTDINGQTTFTYIGNGGVGTDLIDACFTNSAGHATCSQVVTKEWTIPDIDFNVSNIKPVQVVWDADINGDKKIDLVAGKSTMIRYSIGADEYLPLGTPVDVKISFDGKDRIITETIGGPVPEKDGYLWYTKDFYPDSPPSQTGDQTITVEVDPSKKIPESKEDNNKDSTSSVTIKETKGLYLIYIPVDKPLFGSGYGPIDMKDYSDTVENGGKFVLATFPIAKGKFINIGKDKKYYGSYPTQLGAMFDAINIWTLAKILSRGSADRGVGIVPDDNYFKYHGYKDENGEATASGITFPGVQAPLVQNGYWTITAHEIGHSYNLRLQPPLGPGEEYDTYPAGKPSNGFWVDEKKEILNGVCFMGPGAPGKYSFKFADLVTGPQLVWLDNDDYKDLFNKFKTDKKDPEIILLSGIISKNDVIQILPSYFIESGTIDDTGPVGDYSILVSDINGKILSDTKFDASFNVYLDPIGVKETDFAGFTFTIPYPKNTFKIQIKHNEKILTEINPNTKLLHDAINLIPDKGFVNNPDQNRKALHNKIDATEKMLEENNIKGATEKLQNDVRDKFVKWLVDDYTIEDPLQLSKEEVIKLVDEIIKRLNSL